MATKITARIPSVQYGYIEVETDDTAEFAEAFAFATDFVSEWVGAPAVDHTPAAVNALQQGGILPPGLSNTLPANAPLAVQAAADAPVRQNKYGDYILGVDPVSGQEITYSPKGKYGPFVKADIFGNAPKGWPIEVVPTLDKAVDWLASKREWNAKNGK